jgi:putative holliday junction resolvase
MILGIDYGERRIGVAAADPKTRFARPLEVIDARAADPAVRVAELARQLGATRIVVGRPTSLSGLRGPAVRLQHDFVTRLRGAIPVPVVEFDERLTTVVAEQGLRAAGASRAARSRLRDAVSAQVMLQGYLDSSPCP